MTPAQIRQPDGKVRVVEHVFQGRWRSIRAVLADAGQDFPGDPLFEFLGFGFPAAEDQAVEAGFIDNSAVLTQPIDFIETLYTIEGCVFVLVQNDRDVFGVSPQGRTDVLCHEPRFTVLIGNDCATLAELGVLEELNVRAQSP